MSSFFNADVKSKFIILNDKDTTPSDTSLKLYNYNSNIYWEDLNISNTASHLLRRMPINLDSETANLFITDVNSQGLIKNTIGELQIQSNVNISNAIVFSSNGGVDETIGLHNIQGTSTSSILIKSNNGGINLTGSNGGIKMNKVVVGVQQITTDGSTAGIPIALTTTKSVLSFELNNSSANYYTLNKSVSSNNTGQLLHIFYTNLESTGTARLDFGSGFLYSGSGPAQYLTFESTGEAATLININNALNKGWRIINTGALVS
jgi:hypothetical protein